MTHVEKIIHIIERETDSQIKARETNENFYNIVSNHNVNFKPRSNKWGVIIQEKNSIKIVLDINSGKVTEEALKRSIKLPLGGPIGSSRFTFKKDNKHDVVTIILKNTEAENYHFECKKFIDLLQQIRFWNH